MTKTLEAWQKMPGALHRNRMHARSFSVEMFHVNSNQLLVFLRSNIDPKGIWAGLSDLDESHRTLRECARRLHNFLAGAMTLVDHTRVLMDKNYKNTRLAVTFKNGIELNFAKNPTTRFVQDLRNFMVHRGMPPFGRALRVQPIAGGAPNLVNVAGDWYLTKAELMVWDGWKAEAKAYLRSAAEEIDVIGLVE